MNKNTKTTINIVAFVLLFALLWGGYSIDKSRLNEFKSLQAETESLSNTSKERVMNSVITVPDGDTVVGLKDGVGSYKYIDKVTDGEAKLQVQYLQTKFIQGEYRGQAPRLDAIVPMTVSVDSFGGSTYIVLFQDRGDVALEKSYARIGGSNIVIASISTAEGSEVGVEYEVVVWYTQKSIEKSIIIPVIDGRFNAEKTVVN